MIFELQTSKLQSCNYSSVWRTLCLKLYQSSSTTMMKVSLGVGSLPAGSPLTSITGALPLPPLLPTPVLPPSRRRCWGEPAAQSVYLVRSSLLLPPGGVQSTPTIVIMVRSTAITTSANACEAASAGTTASTIQNPSVALTWSDEKESGRYSACCMAQRFIW